MNKFNLKRIFMAVGMALLLTACGGGGDSVAGIGGTGITSSGTITGFGSIFVNGVEFETTGAAITLDDDISATENQLGLGMVVTVTGEVDSAGNMGLAESVVFDDAIEGPITGPVTLDPDGQTKTFIIFGQTIVVNKNTTVFESTGFETIKVNDVVEVSGFVDNQGKINATRLEWKSDFAGAATVELKGVVSNLNRNTTPPSFDIGAATIGYTLTGTVFDDLTEAELANGLSVEVKGNYDGFSIIASKIEKEEEGFGDDIEKASIEGLITDFVSDANFKLQGQTIDASNAELKPASLVLVNGLKVEAEGSIEGGILKAKEVETEDGELKFEASIFLVNGNIITLSYPAPPLSGFSSQLVSITVNSGTKIEVDGANSFEAALASLSGGDFVKIEAFDNGTGELIATELKTEDSGDLKLKGSLDEDATQSLPGNCDVKILGVCFKTDASTKFEDENDLLITPNDFFAKAKVGVVVKVKDEKQGNELGDGIADEIEFED